MIVCLCRGVSDTTIRAAIACGARTSADLGECCGAGTDCGSCRPVLRDLLVEALLADAAPHDAAVDGATSAEMEAAVR